MTASPPIWDNIPQELKSLRHWVLWKIGVRDGKPTKIPLRADSGLTAESDDQTTWATFDNAKEAFEQGRGGAVGAGFVFARATGITGIDLDHCIAPNGEIDAWAQEIAIGLNSYTEISPSGTGLHILVKGSIPITGKDGGRKKALKGDGYRPDAAIEMYSNGRYFTMTGNVLHKLPLTVEDRQDQLSALYDETFGPAKNNHTKTEGKSQEKAQDGPREAPNQKEIDKIYKAICKGKNFEQYTSLMKGNTAPYCGDDSAADLALCNILAFYCNKNPILIDAIFRKSKLMRDKWDEDRGGQTYGEMTIAKAIADTTQTWAGDHGEKKADSSPPPSDTIDPQVLAQANEIIMAGRFPEFWTEVFLRRHNGDSHIAMEMPIANLTANIQNSTGIAVLQVGGPSGDGKSHAVLCTAQQMGKWCDISGLSPMALLYHAGKTIFAGMMVVLDDNRPSDQQADIIKKSSTQFKTGYRYKTVIKGEDVVLQMPPGIQLLTTEVDADSEDQVLNRCLFGEVEGSPEKDLAIIEADLARLESGDLPDQDPDILVCQAAFDLLKSKSYVVTIPEAKKRIKWTERSKDQRANIRNYNIFKDIILAYAVMRWPGRANQEKDGIVHVEATRQDFMDALSLYHAVHKQMRTKLLASEIKLLTIINDAGGRILKEDAQKKYGVSRQRIDALCKGKNGTGGLSAKYPGFYEEDAQESISRPGEYNQDRVRRKYLCLHDTVDTSHGQSLITSLLSAQWMED